VACGGVCGWWSDLVEGLVSLGRTRRESLLPDEGAGCALAWRT